MADPIWNARNWGVYQRAFPDMDWRKKWRKTGTSQTPLMGSYLGDRNRLPDPNARFRSIDNTMVDPNWSVASTYPAKTPHTPMAGKKGLSMKNMIKALTEMKKPADLKAPGAKLMGEARPQLPGPPPFAPLGGVNQSIMNTGGLPGDRNKKWWEIMGYS